MDKESLRLLLEELSSGRIRADEVVERLSRLPFADIGEARVDHHRFLRQGIAEAVYGQGKTPEQCAAVVAELMSEPGGPVVLTRADGDQVKAALAACPGGKVSLSAAAGKNTVVWRPLPERPERVLVVTAGTSDLPVAGEAVAVLEAYGFQPRLITDAGVAGIHRILREADALAEADGVVVVAGMEGALASVVGGITPAPVVAVPTSTGYGSGLEGVTALLAMLASCAAGICVVGIDNGFGAACALARALR
jgi:NCAIR mutase (PurE)-related protein